MSQEHHYITQGTCSRSIDITLDGDVIEDVTFTGGCNGNLKGIGSLIKGKKAADVIPLLEGITCGPKQTSCPDQLARALKEYTA